MQAFEKFLKIFQQKNALINLSSIREADDIVEKHFVDSVMLAVFYDFQEQVDTPLKVADLWTGWGFPGIPLALIAPEAQFTLIDSVAKKLRCVDEFAQELSLKNISTLAGRAEEIGQNPQYREAFDLVVSRATAYFPTLLEYALPLVKVGGIFAAYKLTDKEEFLSIKKALARLGGKILKIKNYEIAGQERSIVFIEKVSTCHKKYPRKIWEPLKNPII